MTELSNSEVAIETYKVPNFIVATLQVANFNLLLSINVTNLLYYKVAT
jgi:hypothetical protein